MNPIKRAWLFARDYINDLMGYSKTCARCGTLQTVSLPFVPTTNTAVSNANFAINWKIPDDGIPPTGCAV